jgi:tricarballylate dehydrogenase
VLGVRAARDGRAADIRGGAVILATGGFQGSREMMLEHAGPIIAKNVQLVGSPENTGDGHLMAQAVGAQMRHLGVVHIRTTDLFFGQGPSRYLAHIYPMGIYFNQRFERFVDEGVADSDTVANAIAFQPGSVAGLLFDEKARAQHPKEFDRYPRRQQLIRAADSIEELARMMDLAPQGLKRVVKSFNASIADGRASGPNVPKSRLALPIDTPPYYGFYPVRPALNHTLGGLVIDSDTCQVLEAAGSAIPGLYAAGTIVNWAYGRPFQVDAVTSYRGSYHAGASSGAGTALVFGRLAGAQAAKMKRQS